MSPGTTAKLTVWRGGEEKSLSVTLGDLPEDREARAAAPRSGPSDAEVPKLGLTLAPAAQVFQTAFSRHAIVKAPVTSAFSLRLFGTSPGG
jgi:hypothetical protein